VDELANACREHDRHRAGAVPRTGSHQADEVLAGGGTGAERGHASVDQVPVGPQQCEEPEDAGC
jgi:hypothetical protein